MSFWHRVVASRGVAVMGALTVVVSACATSAESTTTTEGSAPASTSTTSTVDGDPLIGTWFGFDADGSALGLHVEAGSDGDGYDWTFTDDHTDLCLDFGRPIAVQLSGKGRTSDIGIELTSEEFVCITDWGAVSMDRGVTMEMSLEGDTLTDGDLLCLHKTDPTACGGTSAELEEAPPNFEALVAQYGEAWLTENYQGDAREQLVAALDPCAVSTGQAAADYEVIRAELSDLPRHLTCGLGGVWVYLRAVDGAVLLGQDLQIASRLEGVGQPKANSDMVVFHTFNTVDVLDDLGAEVTRVVEYPDTNYVRDAVPFGGDRLLVATNDITLHELDGSVVWTSPSDGYDQIVEGDDEFWAATRSGKLARIPKDGSEPLIIDVPEAVWGGSTNLRPAPNIAPVPGGAVFTNADNTVQFVSDNGTLGTKIDVGPPPRGDSGHIIPVRPLFVVGEYVYTEDADKRVFRFRSDGTGQAEQVTSRPAGEAAELNWFFEGGNVVGRNTAGSAVHTIPIGLDPQHSIWTGTSLFITIQGGNNGAPGAVIEIRPAS